MLPRTFAVLPVFALAACGGSGWKGVSSGSKPTKRSMPDAGVTATHTAAPLSEDTLVFEVRVGSGASEIHAFDVATSQRRKVFTVADTTTWDLTDLALSPSRDTIAFSSHFGYDPMQFPLEDGLPTQSIWAVDVDGAAPRQLMAPLADDRGAIECTHDSTCEPLGMKCSTVLSRCRDFARTRTVSELVWSPDGAAVWFVYADHDWQGTQLRGGTTLGRVAATGGAPELFAANGGCAQVTGPAPHPVDGSLVAVQSVCTRGGARMVRFDSMPPREGTELFSEADVEFSIDLSDVEWARDGSGFIFGAWGGAFASDAVVYLEAATGTLYLAFEAGVGRWIESQDLAPDGERMVVCVGETGADGEARRDLYLVDLTATTPSARRLTTDGRSCNASW
ncbi:MAG: hypothetical protein RIT81_24950 [Deltaproteobacteria bacterium]